MTHLVVMPVCTCVVPKTQSCSEKDLPPRLTTPNSITWACGAAKFTLKQVQRGRGRREGKVMTIIPLNYLITDSDFTFSAHWSGGNPMMSKT